MSTRIYEQSNITNRWKLACSIPSLEYEEVIFTKIIIIQKHPVQTCTDPSALPIPNDSASKVSGD